VPSRTVTRKQRQGWHEVGGEGRRRLVIIIVPLKASSTTPQPLIELTVATAPDYLAQRGFDAASLAVRELAGGVSNTVLLVEHRAGRFVLKQALPQLRVEQEWFCDIRRIFVEANAIRSVTAMLPEGSAPQVLFEDQDNYLFAMTAAEPGFEPWKSHLLASDCDTRVAEAVGRTLGAIIRQSWYSEAMAAQFADISYFDELRLDPYYTRLATIYPDLRPWMERLIESCRTRRVSLVHGDWSPKNILVKDGRAMAIDFEVMHFGDPSFDAAFLLNHLLLKTFHGIEGAPGLAGVFWKTLLAEMPAAPWFEEAVIAQLGGLLLARMDGKSPAEYIRDPELKDRIRRFARALILTPPKTVAEVWERHAAER
jgi:5-methylthioribose kinase